MNTYGGATPTHRPGAAPIVAKVELNASVLSVAFAAVVRLVASMANTVACVAFVALCVAFRIRGGRGERC